MLIALDWGTSSLRAWLLDANGTLVDSRAAPLGIMRIPDARFEDAFRQICAGWIDAHPGTRVVACGMIGSRQGWREAPYVACPARVESIAASLLRFWSEAGTEIALVPGVSLRGAVPDVMRGEETQIFGALGDDADALAVLPGTHSKWVRIRGGRIEWFGTFMTGELFSVLREHSVLGRLMEGSKHDEQAFQRGVDFGMAGGGVAGKLFSVRTLGLFGEVPAAALHAYLSGLLIGDEIATARERVQAGDGFEPLLIGEPALVELYERAFMRVGLRARIANPAVAMTGLRRIASVARLI